MVIPAPLVHPDFGNLSGLRQRDQAVQRQSAPYLDGPPLENVIDWQRGAPRRSISAAITATSVLSSARVRTIQLDGYCSKPIPMQQVRRPAPPTVRRSTSPPTGGEVEAINGPHVKPTYAVGSLEWQREQEQQKNALDATMQAFAT
jgi:hypothetical protein